MRARGPFEVKPRQLRALVLLLALLPMIPTGFVVRFLLEDITSQRLERRERARPLYQSSLERTTEALAAEMTRSLGQNSADRPWRIFDPAAGVPNSRPALDAILLIDRNGHLSLPPPPPPPFPGDHAVTLASAVLDSGMRVAVLPRSGAPRWRYFSEIPEPLFALQPAASDAGVRSGLLLLRTRAHLRESIETFYERESDAQVAVRLLDENGEGATVSSAPRFNPAGVGEPLAEVPLPAPLPAWRAQIFILDPALVEGIAREQIAFYCWAVGGMFVITAGLAATAGWALTRRIALHELSNDALAVVSHEMKTPLASIRLFIETLLDRRYREGSGQAEEYLRLIAEENARLERLVDGFQTLSRVGHRRGRARRPKEAVPAGEIADAAVRRLRARLETPDCEFVIEGRDVTASVRVDREEIVTVLVNLLDNALKYTGDHKKISLRCRATGNEVFYEVSDNGPGIESDEQQRIFERFYQSDQRLSRSHEGVGLGLSIVRSIVHAHSGTVAVQSHPGEGSVFTVRLPLASV